MRFNRQAVSVQEALASILSKVTLLDTESVSLLESFTRRLGEEITADSDVPHFVKSGMDGFAVKGSDICGASPVSPVLLDVSQTIPCGSVPSLPITSGQASRIMTGAALPEGADTVVMFEMTEDVIENGAVKVAIKKKYQKVKTCC